MRKEKFHVASKVHKFRMGLRYVSNKERYNFYVRQKYNFKIRTDKYVSSKIKFVYWFLLTALSSSSHLTFTDVDMNRGCSGFVLPSRDPSRWPYLDISVTNQLC